MSRPHACRRPGDSRKGAALIVALVSLLLAIALASALVQVARVSRQRLDRANHREQAELLADSAWRRAIAERAADPAYAGETWELTAEEVGTGRAARVTIEIVAANDASSVWARIEALYPVDIEDGFRAVRERVIHTSAGAVP